MIRSRERWAGALALVGLLLAGSVRAGEKTADALAKRIDQLDTATSVERKEVIGAVRKVLQEKKGNIGIPEARLAVQTAQALEYSEGAEALAAEAYSDFGKLMAHASNKQVSEFGVRMQGAGRRLGSLGKEIEIRGQTSEGKEIDLAKLRGKVVLVDFWATWCGPCLKELPNIKKMYAKYHDKGFDVIGVSIDENKEALAGFLKDEKLPWPSIFDLAAPETKQMNYQYGIIAIPQAILVDRQGRVVSLHARGEVLQRELGRLLEKK